MPGTCLRVAPYGTKVSEAIADGTSLPVGDVSACRVTTCWPGASVRRRQTSALPRRRIPRPRGR